MKSMQAVAITPELITAVTALAAVIVTPIISLYVVRKEIDAKVLSENRQAWINELRERIATFVTLAQTYPMMLDTDSSVEKSSRYERTKALRHCANEIALYVNPAEVDHSRLMALIRDAEKRCSFVPDSDADFTELVGLAQIVLKREWARVKSGK
jgi:hypothetical protein